MKALLARFVREESGQDLIEYGLLVGIITSGAILAINAIGPKVSCSRVGSQSTASMARKPRISSARFRVEEQL